MECLSWYLSSGRGRKLFIQEERCLSRWQLNSWRDWWRLAWSSAADSWGRSNKASDLLADSLGALLGNLHCSLLGASLLCCLFGASLLGDGLLDLLGDRLLGDLDWYLRNLHGSSSCHCSLLMRICHFLKPLCFLFIPWDEFLKNCFHIIKVFLTVWLVPLVVLMPVGLFNLFLVSFLDFAPNIICRIWELLEEGRVENKMEYHWLGTVALQVSENVILDWMILSLSLHLDLLFLDLSTWT